MEVNDAAVVAQAIAGDQESFRVLVQRHSGAVFRVAFRMTGNHMTGHVTFLFAYSHFS